MHEGKEMLENKQRHVLIHIVKQLLGDKQEESGK